MTPVHCVFQAEDELGIYQKPQQETVTVQVMIEGKQMETR